MKFAAHASGLRESEELAILVASVGPTALRVDRPSIDARPDPCPRERGIRGEIERRAPL
jgi:hypothetical protein